MKTASAWIAAAGFIVLAAAALALPLIAQTPEEVESRRALVEGLSPSAKRELQRKKERFDRLPASEQQRMRQLDAQISNHPRSAELRQVLERYGQWLASLQASQRNDLRKIPSDERVAEIVKLWQGEQDERLSRIGLSKSDAKIIFDWFNQFTINHADRLEATIPERERERFKNLRMDDPRREFIRRGHALRTLDRILSPWPPEDFDLLAVRLSNAKSTAIDRLLDSKRSGEERVNMLAIWVRESVMHELRPPPPSQQDVQRIIERLPPEERKEWEQLPREEINRRLRERWEHQWWRMFTRGPRHGFDGDRRPRGGRDRWNDDDGRRRWENRDGEGDRGRNGDGRRDPGEDDGGRDQRRRIRFGDPDDRRSGESRGEPARLEADGAPTDNADADDAPAAPSPNDSDAPGRAGR